MTPDAFEQTLAPLWRRAQSGDEAAYREALRLMAGRVRGFLRRRAVEPADDLEDLVQEVIGWLAQRRDLTVADLDGVEETIEFRLPRRLQDQPAQAGAGEG